MWSCPECNKTEQVLRKWPEHWNNLRREYKKEEISTRQQKNMQLLIFTEMEIWKIRILRISLQQMTLLLAARVILEQLRPQSIIQKQEIIRPCSEVPGKTTPIRFNSNNHLYQNYLYQQSRQKATCFPISGEVLEKVVSI